MCARIHVPFNIYMCFLRIGQSQPSDPSAGPQFCSASSAVSLFYTCLRLRAVSTKPLQPTLGLVSKSITEHPRRWPFHRMKTWSVSRWHRWEWIDFVTCVSHTLPTQYADYTLSSWQLHGALCGTVVGNMLNKKYFFFGPWKMFSTGHILCASVLCVVICGGALLQMFQETFTSEWFWKTSAKRLRHQPTTQRSSRALKTPGSF